MRKSWCMFAHMCVCVRSDDLSALGLSLPTDMWWLGVARAADISGKFKEIEQRDAGGE